MINISKKGNIKAGGAAVYEIYIDTASELPAGGIIEGEQAALGSSAVDVSTGTTYRLNSSGVWINQSTGGKTIQITQQPENAEAGAGEEAAFSVAASGDSLSYKWQSSSDGTQWSDISGATSVTYTVTAIPTDNGKYFHCVISDVDSNSVTSSAATLTVVTPEIVITSQPENVSVTEGETAAFVISASGYELTYQWQISSSGAQWTDISSATAAEYTFTASEDVNGYYYRCTVTDGGGNSASSNAVVLTVSAAESEE